MPQLFTIEEIAATLKVKRPTVIRYIHDGKLSAIDLNNDSSTTQQTGRKKRSVYRITQQALLKFLGLEQEPQA